MDDLDDAGETPAWEKGAVLTATELEGCAPAADWSRWIARGRAPVSTPPDTTPGGPDDADHDHRSADGAAAVGTATGTTAGSGRSPAARDEDLDQLAGLGLDSVMVTLEWARLEPRPGEIDGAVVESHLDLLRSARARGLRVWACLIDGTLPGWFADDEGGFSDDRARGLLWPRHVDWAGETFGQDIDGWVPQREPLLWALRRHLLGEAPPGQRDPRAAANAVQAAMLADGEAWRLLRGTAPVATYQTGRTIVPQPDASDGRRGDGGLKARRWAQLTERLLWHPWLSALSEGQLIVGDLPSRTVEHLRGAFDRVVVELRPAIQVDGAGAWSPYPPERPVGPSGWVAWVEGMGECLHRTAEVLGDHEIIGAGSLADVNDDGRARPDHVQAVLELVADAARTTSVAGWWQTSPIDGYHWQRGYTVHPGLIDTQRRESPAADAFRRHPH